MNESETRQKVIEQLEELKSEYQKRVSNPIYDGEEPRRKLNALDFAISSIKTDLKYDLLYEGEEIYTKADMVDMLEELKKEIIALPFPQKRASYMQGYNYCQMNILNYIIQEKINVLIGEKDNGK